MSEPVSLPEELLSWVGTAVGGTVRQATRLIARREAWVVEVQRGDGGSEEYVLRIDRDRDPGNPWSVKKEGQVVSALKRAGLPVPGVHGWSEDFQAVLFDRCPGRADFFNDTTADQRWEILWQFIPVIVELHGLDVADLGLAGVLDWPESPEDVALSEVEKSLQLMRSPSSEPLIPFGVRWLRRNVPQQVGRVSLVQGDTGPGNFLFEGRTLTAIIDFEWAHFGDPVEDLAHLRMRETFFPSGHLHKEIELYEQLAGMRVERSKMTYYTIQILVRNAIWLWAMTTNQDLDLNPALALNLCSRVVIDRITCEALAETMGVRLEKPEPIGDVPFTELSMGRAAVDNIQREVLPAMPSGWPRRQLEHVGLLIECMDRLALMGPTMERCELDDLTTVLGHRPSTVAGGVAELNRVIEEEHSDADDEEILRYLARRAYRLEELYQPLVVNQFPWAELPEL